MERWQKLVRGEQGEELSARKLASRCLGHVMLGLLTVLPQCETTSAPVASMKSLALLQEGRSYVKKNLILAHF